MKRELLSAGALSACIVLGASLPAAAVSVAWDVDSAQSFVTLNIADQNQTIDGTSANIRFRDAGSTTAWNNAGGRRAALDGIIQSNYTDGVSIDFLGGTHDLFALQQTNLRPDPALFNPADTNAENPNGRYSGTGLAAAAFGARVRAVVTIFIIIDAAFVALRNVSFDLDSGTIALGGGTTLATNLTTFAMDSAVLDIDGVSGVFGQPVPDLLNGSHTQALQTNSGTGLVQNLGGDNRQLNLAINIPFSLTIDDITVTGTATGTIVANATLPPAVAPEPASAALALAAGGLTLLKRNRTGRR